LASERVSRKKHDGSSVIAYQYLKDRLSPSGFRFGGKTDLFNPAYTEYQPLHHHLAHAAAAYYPSGFEEAAVLVIDGQGAYKLPKICASSSIWKGKNQDISMLEANTEDDIATQSIGHLYACVSFYLGFGFLQEGKVMGLAAYGEQSDLLKVFQKYISQEQDGRYRIHPKFVRALIYLTEGRTFFRLEDSQPSELTQEVMSDIVSSFGQPRQKGAPISERDKNLAWAVQHTAETLILGLAERTHTLTGCDNLCYSGGVALNSVANGKLKESGIFKNIFIMPAAGDEGQAVGRLLYRANNEFGIPRAYVMENAYLGPGYDEAEIVQAIKTTQESIVFTKMNEADLLKTAASELANGKIIGWWLGRSEIGPRALGHRSILADPRGDNTRDFINFTVKHREWFRPLAPSILLEAVPDYFEKAIEKAAVAQVAAAPAAASDGCCG